jgi:phosphonate transport system substrate-binding protein
MMHPLRFALFSDSAAARPAFDEMAQMVQARSEVALEAMFVSSYAGLAQSLDRGACELAWSPPLVAQGLLASAVGKPLVTVGRGGRTSYFSVLLARDGIQAGATQALQGTHVGWVSKLSAAGYVVPSLYLRSLGLEPDEIFAQQSFLGSHAAVLRALHESRVDVAATYASIASRGRTFVLPDGSPPGARVITAAGPIPGDVIFAASHVEVNLREALRRAFLSLEVNPSGPLSKVMNVSRFEVPALDHFETLRRWHVRAVESEPRVHAAPQRVATR